MPANATTLKLTKDLPRKEVVFTLARVPGSQRVIFGGSDFRVHDVDLAAEKPEVRDLGAHESYVTGVAIAARNAVSGSYDGRLIWWDLETGSKVRAVEAHAKWIRGVAASPDGTLIASVADDMVCRLWDAETGEKRHELHGHEARTPSHFPSMLYACAFSPDGKHLATGDKVGHVVVWDVATGQPAATFEAPGMYTWDPTQRRHSIGGIRALAFSPDGTRIAVGGIGKIGNIDHLEGPPRVEVFHWSADGPPIEFSVDAFKGLVERLVFLPGGDRLLAGGGANDGFLLVLDLPSKSVPLQEKAPMHVHDLALGEAPGTVLVAGHGKMAVYELKD